MGGPARTVGEYPYGTAKVCCPWIGGTSVAVGTLLGTTHVYWIAFLGWPLAFLCGVAFVVLAVLDQSAHGDTIARARRVGHVESPPRRLPELHDGLQRMDADLARARRICGG